MSTTLAARRRPDANTMSSWKPKSRDVADRFEGGLRSVAVIGPVRAGSCHALRHARILGGARGADRD